MVAPTKTKQTLLSHGSLAHVDADGVSVVGSAVDVSTYFSGDISIWMANIEATAQAVAPKFVLEGSPESSGDEDWTILRSFMGSTDVGVVKTIDGSEAAGQTTIDVNNTTSVEISKPIYVRDTTVVADGEWGRVASLVAGATINLASGLTNAKDSADTMCFPAEEFSAYILLDGINRLRLSLFLYGATGSDVHYKSTGLFTSAIS